MGIGKFHRRARLLLTALLAGHALASVPMQAKPSGGIEEIQRTFQTPPDDARVMMRWWWFGPAVTGPEITRELHAMKDAGIGGVEIQSVYPLALDDPGAGIKNFAYLSDEHLDALRHANREARALGLRVDLTLGSGWPFGGPSVPIGQASSRLRVERVKLADGQDRVRLPKIEAGEQLIAAFLAHANGTAISPDGIRELSVGTDETVALPPDRAGATEVAFFISSRTKQQVKRASVGAEGFVLDHYDRTAVEAYLHHVGDRLMQAFDDQPPYAVFCDSLEVYGADWTPDLLAEFQKRRGYDLKPSLPALIGDFGPRTTEVRHDYGLTLTELFNERFVQTIHEWAARHHTRFRLQGYGVPPAALSTGRLADLPEGEGFQWRSLSATRWASSASHLYGRPVTSSECWTWLHSPAFRATPLDMKAEADLHFLEGINQLIGHGWPYSAPGVTYPGWRFYAAGAFDDQNPWWMVMPDLTRYLQRTSAILRQGQPVNDVAIYLPSDDAWTQIHGKDLDLFETLGKRIGKDLVATVLSSGYGVDFVDDEALRLAGDVEAGTLAFGASRYKAVILPGVERIPADTLRKLADFAGHGGVLIATGRLPERAPGFGATDAERREVTETVQRLFKSAAAPAHFADDDKAALAGQLTSLVTPDLTFAGSDATGLGFVHRRADEADLYFVVNTTPARCDVNATFRVNAARAEAWNLFTGEIDPVATTAGTTGRVLPLALEPYESRLIVFTHRDLPTPTAPPPSAAGSSSPLDLSMGWQVSFGNGKTVTMDQLRSWTDDPATRNYSGQATYVKSFDLPPGGTAAGTRTLLDFGPAQPLPIEPMRNGMRAWIDAPVREAAAVFLNSTPVGVLWHPPYILDVSHALRPGINELKVVVGNTAINHLAGTRLPDDKALTQRYGERFKPQDMDHLQPLPSGLLGPIRLLRAGPNP